MLQLTAEARRYMVAELARRAGVAPELLASWKIEATAERTVVTIDEKSAKKIVFPNSGEGGFSNSQSARLTWMRDPLDSVRQLVPDFIVPFIPGVEEGRPLFFRSSPNEIDCSVDLLTSGFLNLNRCEEGQVSERDEHGRFLAKQSITIKENFIDRPIMDEYGLGLEQAIQALLPAWKAEPRVYRTKFSHDMDLIGIPFSLRTTIGHTVKRYRPMATVQDLLSTAGFGEPAYFRLVRKQAGISLDRGLDSAFYWIASEPSQFDTGYDPGAEPVLGLIRWLQRMGFEQGIHPSYYSFQNRERLQSQVEYLRAVFQSPVFGGRQHYLRWSSETWGDWENCGLAYDSTLTHASVAGFRAGTCIPYHPWNFAANRPFRLLEIPLIVMEASLMSPVYMALGQQQALDYVRRLVARCRLIGGVFTLLFHTSSMLEPEYHSNFYLRLLDEIGSGCKYDWRANF